jgi:hypothetical protein
VQKADLKIDWCTHQAAKYAVENWHYSKRLPMHPLVMVGAWEREKYVGCILFARGANMNIGAPYGLIQTECAELVRVALRDHEMPVSRIMSIAFKFLRKNSEGVRLLVSYADPRQGHHGGIYQATGWMYVGCSDEATEYLHEGRWKHSREVISPAFGGSNSVGWKRLLKRKVPGKHKYLFPLDEDMRKQIAPLSKPYPKRSVQIGVGPSSPTGEQ